MNTIELITETALRIDLTAQAQLARLRVELSKNAHGNLLSRDLYWSAAEFADAAVEHADALIERLRK